MLIFLNGISVQNQPKVKSPAYPGGILDPGTRCDYNNQGSRDRPRDRILRGCPRATQCWPSCSCSCQGTPTRMCVVRTVRLPRRPLRWLPWHLLRLRMLLLSMMPLPQPLSLPPQHSWLRMWCRRPAFRWRLSDYFPPPATLPGCSSG